MSLFESQVETPLAERLRPTDLSGVVGQEHLLGSSQFLRGIIERRSPVSMILWGPPGTGKTTLARIIARASNYSFVEISAVTSGIADVKKVIEAARERKRLGQGTLLFVDEIHRFNKAQQDAFLPHVENGTIVLIGATTENPSFEVIGPLLSRSRVVVLEPLSTQSLEDIIDQGLKLYTDVSLEDSARQLLAELSAGDARMALGGLEAAIAMGQAVVTREHIKQAMQKTGARYDKGGEYHYNVISAYIKSLRGGAVDAALLYLARMLEGGEDPKFIARRLVIFASEDVGVADNTMMTLALSTFQAVERIGLPECQLTLAHATVALALSAKSRATTDALGLAKAAAAQHPTATVPNHLRNAPTALMKQLDYGKGTKWEAGFVHPEGFMPDGLEDLRFYSRDSPEQSHK